MKVQQKYTKENSTRHLEKKLFELIKKTDIRSSSHFTITLHI